MGQIICCVQTVYVITAIATNQVGYETNLKDDRAVHNYSCGMRAIIDIYSGGLGLITDVRI